MAIVYGVFAGIKGKVGNVIYQVNKGAQILKQYAVPENPNTSGQQAVRGVFGDIVTIFKVLATTWVRYFWNPFIVGNEQGWGNFIGANIDSMGTSFTPLSAVLSKGSLEGCYDFTCTYDTATGNIVVTFDSTCFGNGLSTDHFSLAFYDQTEKRLVGFSFSDDTRADEGTATVVEDGLTATDITAYIVFSDTEGDDDELTMVSNSQACTCSAPA